jgi:hypothetical protein
LSKISREKNAFRLKKLTKYKIEMSPTFNALNLNAVFFHHKPFPGPFRN